MKDEIDLGCIKFKFWIYTYINTLTDFRKYIIWRSIICQTENKKNSLRWYSSRELGAAFASLTGNAFIPPDTCSRPSFEVVLCEDITSTSLIIEVKLVGFGVIGLKNWTNEHFATDKTDVSFNVFFRSGKEASWVLEDLSRFGKLPMNSPNLTWQVESFRLADRASFYRT